MLRALRRLFGRGAVDPRQLALPLDSAAPRRAPPASPVPPPAAADHDPRGARRHQSDARTALGTPLSSGRGRGSGQPVECATRRVQRGAFRWHSATHWH